MSDTTTTDNIIIDVHMTKQNPDLLRDEIRSGLLSSPKTLPTKYMYDDRGSELFERICTLPEYYQTRTEYKILMSHSDQIIKLTGADELVELGSGAATKTRVLLDAMEQANQLRFYVPFDVSEGIVRRVAQELVNEYEGLQIHGVVGDFLAHLEHIPDGGRRLVIILGGTVGNLDAQAAPQFLSSIYDEMASGDFFLLGVQLETDLDRLEAAYNDSAGITAEFNKNILLVIGTMLEATFDVEKFEHVARYNTQHHRIEMHLRSREDQTIHIPKLDMVLHVKEGEEILTEISTKYDRPRTEQLLAQCGFDLLEWFTDSDQLMALALAKKP